MTLAQTLGYGYTDRWMNLQTDGGTRANLYVPQSGLGIKREDRISTVKPRLYGMHLSGNTAIWTDFLGNEKTLCNFAPFSRTVVWGTNPCFTMTIGLCYADTCLSVIDFKANWQ